jgi:hypothetical protein
MPILAYPSPLVATKELPKHKHHTTAVILWGRFQPPHIGHLNNFKTAHTKYQTEADIYIVPSSTCKVKTQTLQETYDKLLALQKGSGTKRKAPTDQHQQDTCNLEQNPFTLDEKVTLLHDLLPPTYNILYLASNNIAEIVDTFYSIGYTKVIMYLGADRLKDFAFLLPRVPSGVELTFTGDDTRLTLSINNTPQGASSTLLRKAIYYRQEDIVKQLLNTPPETTFTNKIWPLLTKAIDRSLPHSKLPSTIPLSPEERQQAFQKAIQATKGGFFQTFLNTLPPIKTV